VGRAFLGLGQVDGLARRRLRVGDAVRSGWPPASIEVDVAVAAEGEAM
jgi:hypothetical protein